MQRGLQEVFLQQEDLYTDDLAFEPPSVSDTTTDISIQDITTSSPLTYVTEGPTISKSSVIQQVLCSSTFSAGINLFVSILAQETKGIYVRTIVDS